MLKDAQLAITQLEKRIDRLTAEALALIGEFPELARVVSLAHRRQGRRKGQRHRIDTHRAQVGELLLLPPGLSHREWVKPALSLPKGLRGLIREISSTQRA